jgi:RNA polymerase sigma-70 factor (ECF subfamily)
MVVATSERELLGRLVRREGEAFEHLVAQYQDRLFNFVLRYTGRREDAEEIVQDTFLKAHRALFGRMTPERVLTLALTPWMYRVALNTARNYLRRRQLQTSALPDDSHVGAEQLGEPALAGGGPEAMAENAAVRRAIVAELLRLPERYRAAVVLRFVEGLSYAEIAAATGQPVGTVKSNVHRGLLLMRPGLASWWWHTDDGEVSRELP